MTEKAEKEHLIQLWNELTLAEQKRITNILIKKGYFAQYGLRPEVLDAKAVSD